MESSSSSIEEDALPSSSGRTGRGNWNADRTELLAWLTAATPQVASIYAGAVSILDDDGIPGRHYFIWHAVREIRAALPAAINGVRTERLNPDPYIKVLAAAWRDGGSAPVVSGRAEPSAEPDLSGVFPAVSVSPAVAAAVAELISAHDAVAPRFREANQKALTTILGRDVPPYVARAWTKAFEDAPKYAHVPDLPHPVDETANAIEGFQGFEATLMTITRKSFENMDELDAILARANRS